MRLEACSALGDYAPRMRALITFAAYTIMRPGELFALDRERHVELAADEAFVRERVYKGEHDLPKSNCVRTIALLRGRARQSRRYPSARGSCSARSAAGNSHSRRSRGTRRVVSGGGGDGSRRQRSSAQ